MTVDSVVQLRRAREKAPRPTPRPDRSFYSSGKAFGRFGMRSFAPQIMPQPHVHGHIEFNWLTRGSMDYVFDGGPVTVGSDRLVAFWAGIPHQTIGLSPETAEGRQLNIYLPMDAFLEMPQLGRLTETLMGGGVIQLNPDCIGLETLDRWHQDYRSGNALRTDIVRSEIGTMFRRAAITGWDTLLPAWVETTGTRTRTGSPVRYVVRMVRHIVENITDPLSAEDIAKVVGLHPNYATNLFTKVMHTSVQKFVTRMRLIRARSLLFDGSLSVANVAFQAGFVSQTQFYEHFRKAYGMTPSQMRRDTIEG
ncbi:MAG: helix-turn-helix domain-containing protein [Devosia sp.]|jgi:AraC-like DNA-binding protein|nr:helix-turn-helix domain-containing protein [Alphaproteobacteria bacterium]MBU1560489.1 helix-turn-helix domain-containing protein [Alphaproteobacteria bacterium]MBU2301315.1 helix-turn-helix domain-containing protein [Alphaproteobacteria bacterium]MBU2366782.1 helix-turn-helix domain-containing protein [Alphaproteobacteria bacterium]